jgi:hypothetical protein
MQLLTCGLSAQDLVNAVISTVTTIAIERLALPSVRLCVATVAHSLGPCAARDRRS